MTDIGSRVNIVEFEVGAYTYFAGDASAIYTIIGKYCSIASHVSINPGNHPMNRVMQHHCTYWRVRYGLEGVDAHEFFDWRKKAEPSDRDQAITGRLRDIGEKSFFSLKENGLL